MKVSCECLVIGKIKTTESRRTWSYTELSVILCAISMPPW